MSALPDEQSVMSEVDKIAGSLQFVRSKRLVRFLRFTVSETLAGRADALSEHLIATEAYERRANFDPQLDPIIRSEARRLRSKLNRYYRAEGQRDPLVISYRPGSYAPTFHLRERWESLDLLTRAGDMGALIADFDWSKTSLGPISTWPANLRLVLDVCLRSRFPMAIYWGPELLTLYNDAKAKVLGRLHPAALGRPASVALSAVWDQIGPSLKEVLSTGTSIENLDQRFVVDRKGYPEECYFSCSYSVIRDNNGLSGGVLVLSNETTARVIAERRRAVLRELSIRALEAETPEQACRLAALALSNDIPDIPFAWIYRLENGSSAVLDAADGDPALSSLCPVRLDFSSNSPLAKAAQKLVGHGGTFEQEFVNLHPQFALSSPSRNNGPNALQVLPLHGSRKVIFGLLVVAVSPHRRVDQPYETFLTLVAAHISSAISNAQKHDEETRLAASLVEADEAKTEFLARFSKELRRMSADLAADLEVLPARVESRDPQLKEIIEDAHDRGLLLFKALHSLQMLTNMEQISKEMICELLDLSEITCELAELFRPAIEQAGLELKIQCAPLREPLCLNLEMWETIIVNLLSNALKFTEKGEIGIATRQTGPIAEVVVWDTGKGIPSEELRQIFDRFHGVKVERARSLSRLGMGLPLVKGLLALYGGTIRVESQLHRGSTFTVLIPVGQFVPGDRIMPAHPAPHHWTIAPAYVQDALDWLGLTHKGSRGFQHGFTIPSTLGRK